jgi:hypothetical protein
MAGTQTENFACVSIEPVDSASSTSRAAARIFWPEQTSNGEDRRTWEVHSDPETSAGDWDQFFVVFRVCACWLGPARGRRSKMRAFILATTTVLLSCGCHFSSAFVPSIPTRMLRTNKEVMGSDIGNIQSASF